MAENRGAVLDRQVSPSGVGEALRPGEKNGGGTGKEKRGNGPSKRRLEQVREQAQQDPGTAVEDVAAGKLKKKRLVPQFFTREGRELRRQRKESAKLQVAESSVPSATAPAREAAGAPGVAETADPRLQVRPMADHPQTVPPDVQRARDTARARHFTDAAPTPVTPPDKAAAGATEGKKKITVDIAGITTAGGSDAAEAAAARIAHARMKRHTSEMFNLTKHLAKSMEGNPDEATDQAKGFFSKVKRGVEIGIAIGKETARHPIKTLGQFYETAFVNNALRAQYERSTLQTMKTLQLDNLSEEFQSKLEDEAKKRVEARSRDKKRLRDVVQDRGKGLTTIVKEKAVDFARKATAEKNAIQREELQIAGELRIALMTSSGTGPPNPLLQSEIMNAYQNELTGQTTRHSAMLETEAARKRLEDSIGASETSRLEGPQRDRVVEGMKGLVKEALLTKSKFQGPDAELKVLALLDNVGLGDRLSYATNITGAVREMIEVCESTNAHMDGTAAVQAAIDTAFGNVDLDIRMEDVAGSEVEGPKTRSRATKRAVERFRTARGAGEGLSTDRAVADANLLSATKREALFAAAVAVAGYGSLRVVSSTARRATQPLTLFVPKVGSFISGATLVTATRAAFRAGRNEERNIAAARVASAEGQAARGETAEKAGRAMKDITETSQSLDKIYESLQGKPGRQAVEKALGAISAVDARNRLEAEVKYSLWKAENKAEAMAFMETLRADAMIALRDNASIDDLSTIAKDMLLEVVSNDKNVYIRAIRQALIGAEMAHIRTGDQVVGRFADALSGQEVASEATLEAAKKEERKLVRKARIRAVKTSVIYGETFAAITMGAEFGFHEAADGFSSPVTSSANAATEQPGSTGNIQTMAYTQPANPDGVGSPSGTGTATATADVLGGSRTPAIPGAASEQTLSTAATPLPDQPASGGIQTMSYEQPISAPANPGGTGHEATAVLTADRIPNGEPPATIGDIKLDGFYTKGGELFNDKTGKLAMSQEQLRVFTTALDRVHFVDQKTGASITPEFSIHPDGLKTSIDISNAETHEVLIKDAEIGIDKVGGKPHLAINWEARGITEHMDPLDMSVTFSVNENSALTKGDVDLSNLLVEAETFAQDSKSSHEELRIGSIEVRGIDPTPKNGEYFSATDVKDATGPHGFVESYSVMSVAEYQELSKALGDHLQFERTDGTIFQPVLNFDSSKGGLILTDPLHPDDPILKGVGIDLHAKGGPQLNWNAGTVKPHLEGTMMTLQVADDAPKPGHISVADIVKEEETFAHEGNTGPVTRLGPIEVHGLSEKGGEVYDLSGQYRIMSEARFDEMGKIFGDHLQFQRKDGTIFQPILGYEPGKGMYLVDPKAPNTPIIEDAGFNFDSKGVPELSWQAGTVEPHLEGTMMTLQVAENVPASGHVTFEDLVKEGKIFAHEENSGPLTRLGPIEVHGLSEKGGGVYDLSGHYRIMSEARFNEIGKVFGEHLEFQRADRSVFQPVMGYEPGKGLYLMDPSNSKPIIEDAGFNFDAKGNPELTWNAGSVEPHLQGDMVVLRVEENAPKFGHVEFAQVIREGEALAHESNSGKPTQLGPIEVLGIEQKGDSIYDASGTYRIMSEAHFQELGKTLKDHLQFQRPDGHPFKPVMGYDPTKGLYLYDPAHPNTPIIENAGFNFDSHGIPELSWQAGTVEEHIENGVAIIKVAENAPQAGHIDFENVIKAGEAFVREHERGQGTHRVTQHPVTFPSGQSSEVSQAITPGAEIFVGQNKTPIILENARLQNGAIIGEGGVLNSQDVARYEALFAKMHVVDKSYPGTLGVQYIYHDGSFDMVSQGRIIVQGITLDGKGDLTWKSSLGTFDFSHEPTFTVTNNPGVTEGLVPLPSGEHLPTVQIADHATEYTAGNGRVFSFGTGHYQQGEGIIGANGQSEIPGQLVSKNIGVLESMQFYDADHKPMPVNFVFNESTSSWDVFDNKGKILTSVLADDNNNLTYDHQLGSITATQDGLAFTVEAGSAGTQTVPHEVLSPVESLVVEPNRILITSGSQTQVTLSGITLDPTTGNLITTAGHHVIMPQSEMNTLNNLIPKDLPKGITGIEIRYEGPGSGGSTWAIYHNGEPELGHILVTQNGKVEIEGKAGEITYDHGNVVLQAVRTRPVSLTAQTEQYTQEALVTAARSPKGGKETDSTEHLEGIAKFFKEVYDWEHREGIAQEWDKLRTEIDHLLGIYTGPGSKGPGTTPPSGSGGSGNGAGQGAGTGQWTGASELHIQGLPENVSRTLSEHLVDAGNGKVNLSWSQPHEGQALLAHVEVGKNGHHILKLTYEKGSGGSANSFALQTKYGTLFVKGHHESDGSYSLTLDPQAGNQQIQLVGGGSIPESDLSLVGVNEAQLQALPAGDLMVNGQDQLAGLNIDVVSPAHVTTRGGQVTNVEYMAAIKGSGHLPIEVVAAQPKTSEEMASQVWEHYSSEPRHVEFNRSNELDMQFEPVQHDGHTALELVQEKGNSNYFAFQMMLNGKPVTVFAHATMDKDGRSHFILDPRAPASETVTLEDGRHMSLALLSNMVLHTDAMSHVQMGEMPPSDTLIRGIVSAATLSGPHDNLQVTYDSAVVGTGELPDHVRELFQQRVPQQRTSVPNGRTGSTAPKWTPYPSPRTGAGPTSPNYFGFPASSQSVETGIALGDEIVGGAAAKDTGTRILAGNMPIYLGQSVFKDGAIVAPGGAEIAGNALAQSEKFFSQLHVVGIDGKPDPEAFAVYDNGKFDLVSHGVVVAKGITVDGNHLSYDSGRGSLQIIDSPVFTVAPTQLHQETITLGILPDVSLSNGATTYATNGKEFFFDAGTDKTQIEAQIGALEQMQFNGPSGNLDVKFSYNPITQSWNVFDSSGNELTSITLTPGAQGGELVSYDGYFGSMTDPGGTPTFDTNAEYLQSGSFSLPENLPQATALIVEPGEIILTENDKQVAAFAGVTLDNKGDIINPADPSKILVSSATVNTMRTALAQEMHGVKGLEFKYVSTDKSGDSSWAISYEGASGQREQLGSDLVIGKDGTLHITGKNPFTAEPVSTHRPTPDRTHRRIVHRRTPDALPAEPTIPSIKVGQFSVEGVLKDGTSGGLYDVTGKTQVLSGEQLQTIENFLKEVRIVDKSHKEVPVEVTINPLTKGISVIDTQNGATIIDDAMINTTNPLHPVLNISGMQGQWERSAEGFTFVVADIKPGSFTSDKFEANPIDLSDLHEASGKSGFVSQNGTTFDFGSDSYVAGKGLVSEGRVILSESKLEQEMSALNTMKWGLQGSEQSIRWEYTPTGWRAFASSGDTLMDGVNVAADGKEITWESSYGNLQIVNNEPLILPVWEGNKTIDLSPFVGESLTNEARTQLWEQLALKPQSIQEVSWAKDYQQNMSAHVVDYHGDKAVELVQQKGEARYMAFQVYINGEPKTILVDATVDRSGRSHFILDPKATDLVRISTGQGQSQEVPRGILSSMILNDSELDKFPVGKSLTLGDETKVFSDVDVISAANYNGKDITYLAGLLGGEVIRESAHSEIVVTPNALDIVRDGKEIATISGVTILNGQLVDSANHGILIPPSVMNEYSKFIAEGLPAGVKGLELKYNGGDESGNSSWQIFYEAPNGQKEIFHDIVLGNDGKVYWGDESGPVGELIMLNGQLNFAIDTGPASDHLAMVLNLDSITFLKNGKEAVTLSGNINMVNSNLVSGTNPNHILIPESAIQSFDTFVNEIPPGVKGLNLRYDSSDSAGDSSWQVAYEGPQGQQEELGTIYVDSKGTAHINSLAGPTVKFNYQNGRLTFVVDKSKHPAGGTGDPSSSGGAIPTAHATPSATSTASPAATPTGVRSTAPFSTPTASSTAHPGSHHEGLPFSKKDLEIGTAGFVGVAALGTAGALMYRYGPRGQMRAYRRRTVRDQAREADIRQRFGDPADPDRRVFPPDALGTTSSVDLEGTGEFPFHGVDIGDQTRLDPFPPVPADTSSDLLREAATGRATDAARERVPSAAEAAILARMQAIASREYNGSWQTIVDEARLVLAEDHVTVNPDREPDNPTRTFNEVSVAAGLANGGINARPRNYDRSLLDGLTDEQAIQVRDITNALNTYLSRITQRNNTDGPLQLSEDSVRLLIEMVRTNAELVEYNLRDFSTNGSGQSSIFQTFITQVNPSEAAAGEAAGGPGTARDAASTPRRLRFGNQAAAAARERAGDGERGNGGEPIATADALLARFDQLDEGSGNFREYDQAAQEYISTQTDIDLSSIPNQDTRIGLASAMASGLIALTPLDELRGLDAAEDRVFDGLNVPQPDHYPLRTSLGAIMSPTNLIRIEDPNHVLRLTERGMERIARILRDQSAIPGVADIGEIRFLAPDEQARAFATLFRYLRQE